MELIASAAAQWLVPHDELMARAMEVAEHVASLPPLAARLAKRRWRSAWTPSMRGRPAPISTASRAQVTEDKKEAHQAWARAPQAGAEGR
jgi:enoyl-CoA hydratase/carnithine racemase